MTLEMEAIETSLAKLAPSGWAPGTAYDKDADRELMEDDRVEAAKREQRNKSSGFFSCEPLPPLALHVFVTWYTQDMCVVWRSVYTVPWIIFCLLFRSVGADEIRALVSV